MNLFYAEFITTSRELAESRGLVWDLEFDRSGKVSKRTRWNLTALVGLMPPPTLWLGQVGVDANSFTKMNEIRRRMGQATIIASPMSSDWQNLYKAVFIHQLLIRKNKPMSAIQAAGPIRKIAPVAGDTPLGLLPRITSNRLTMRH